MGVRCLIVCDMVHIRFGVIRASPDICIVLVGPFSPKPVSIPPKEVSLDSDHDSHQYSLTARWCRLPCL